MFPLSYVASMNSVVLPYRALSSRTRTSTARKYTLAVCLLIFIYSVIGRLPRGLVSAEYPRHLYKSIRASARASIRSRGTPTCTAEGPAGLLSVMHAGHASRSPEQLTVVVYHGTCLASILLRIFQHLFGGCHR